MITTIALKKILKVILHVEEEERYTQSLVPGRE
jgi:hypothetical protein